MHRIHTMSYAAKRNYIAIMTHHDNVMGRYYAAKAQFDKLNQNA